MKFAVTVVSPPGYLHSAAFREVAESLHFGLLSLGHDSILTTQGHLAGRQHIVLGSNLLPTYPLPIADSAILYNLEQVEMGGSWFKPELFNIFKRYALWDYSQKNALALAAMGIEVKQVLPIGYTKELTRFQAAPVQDIDVLFVGSLPPRRKAVLDQMGALGLRVAAVFGLYGQERDKAISRAKLMLNVHMYDAKILEIVRISYLLANHCAVLSEHSSDLTEDNALAGGVAFAGYHHLAERARELIDNPAELSQLSRRGFEIMTERPVSEYLSDALTRAGLG
jgi:hypothetical protein